MKKNEAKHINNNELMKSCQIFNIIRNIFLNNAHKKQIYPPEYSGYMNTEQ